jgi:deoxyxylulose-5-phosphate synthase
VHKLLTGRKDRFHTIRTTDGLNGFSLRTESEHDCYGAGHAGTALSAALGMCAARDQRGSDENVVCIFGDAALTNGISFEGLNNIAHTTKRFIGILNDNEWSIAKNVGAISSHLNKAHHQSALQPGAKGRGTMGQTHAQRRAGHQAGPQGGRGAQERFSRGFPGAKPGATGIRRTRRLRQQPYF